MVWLSESDVAHAWGRAKHVMGNAWHKGTKLLGTIDKYADLGIRLLGAASPIMPQKALAMGLNAANEYNTARQKASDVQRGIMETTDRFRRAAPELGI